MLYPAVHHYEGKHNISFTRGRLTVLCALQATADGDSKVHFFVYEEQEEKTKRRNKKGS